MDTVRGQIQWTVLARMENEKAEVPDNLGMIGQSEQHDTALDNLLDRGAGQSS